MTCLTDRINGGDRWAMRRVLLSGPQYQRASQRRKPATGKGCTVQQQSSRTERENAPAGVTPASQGGRQERRKSTMSD
eukprot:CAMPEP_0181225310 /NCGR_PEP_ID=MMETSP1096-20121128/31613_1 /TAXON_ID=156174 ORGANISM="Chrysochromulina ericina, Strain CCMP281" /NCGR_SAMPLE_ID=MMETSP1096 /ASSEMBLY_ACC=CAM_ASM_000453 /LENGTH=77 /DNA_ID=CAMNT_0023318493 /DNA_START=219 /DNA_END=453 /DNA_ORIENTATION=-